MPAVIAIIMCLTVLAVTRLLVDLALARSEHTITKAKLDITRDADEALRKLEVRLEKTETKLNQIETAWNLSQNRRL